MLLGLLLLLELFEELLLFLLLLRLETLEQLGSVEGPNKQKTRLLGNTSGWF